MINDLLSRLPNPVRAALATAFFTFIATAGGALLGLLGELDGWLNTGAEPQWSTYGKIVGSAAIAAGAGLVNFVVRWIQTKKDPTAGPKY
jgi:hypothetical protein